MYLETCIKICLCFSEMAQWLNEVHGFECIGNKRWSKAGIFIPHWHIVFSNHQMICFWSVQQIHQKWYRYGKSFSGKQSSLRPWNCSKLKFRFSYNGKFSIWQIFLSYCGALKDIAIWDRTIYYCVFWNFIIEWYYMTHSR